MAWPRSVMTTPLPPPNVASNDPFAVKRANHDLPEGGRGARQDNLPVGLQRECAKRRRDRAERHDAVVPERRVQESVRGEAREPLRPDCHDLAVRLNRDVEHLLAEYAEIVCDLVPSIDTDTGASCSVSSRRELSAPRSRATLSRAAGL